VIALASLGAAPASMLPQILVTEQVSDTDVLWLIGAFALAAALIGGIVLRVRGSVSRWSTALLLIGSPAPSLAMFWLPPVYLLSLAIAVLAIVSARAADRSADPAAVR
jgi:hypothetical protein